MAATTTASVTNTTPPARTLAASRDASRRCFTTQPSSGEGRPIGRRSNICVALIASTVGPELAAKHVSQHLFSGCRDGLGRQERSVFQCGASGAFGPVAPEAVPRRSE